MCQFDIGNSPKYLTPFTILINYLPLAWAFFTHNYKFYSLRRFKHLTRQTYKCKKQIAKH